MSQSQAPRSRQQRKSEARVAGTGFMPVVGMQHPYGNRQARRRMRAVKRSQAGEGWRRKKYIRGEYYGRKLEAVIRSGAPFSRVRAERIIIRSLLA